MKTKLFRHLMICSSSMLIGCAAAPLNIDIKKNETEYQKGLEYSKQLYSQPIDILREGFTQSENAEKAAQAMSGQPDSDCYLPKYSVQIASFTDQRNARRYLQHVSTQHSNFTFRLFFSENLWRILTEQVDERTDAEILLQKLKKAGFIDAWMVQF